MKTARPGFPHGRPGAIHRGQRILGVDDVFDRGNTLKRVSEALGSLLADKRRTTELGTLYWKPDNNQTDIKPHFHYRVYGGDDWLVQRPELAAKAFPVEESDIT